MNTQFEDVAQVANAVRNLEILQERSGQGVKRNHDGDRVRPVQGNNQGSNDRRSNDRQGYDRSANDNQRSNDRRSNDRRSYDRSANDNQRWRNDQQYRGRQDSRTSGLYGQRGYVNRADSPNCNICGKYHPGKQCHRASGACFICSQTGHMARDCPKNNNNSKGNGGEDRPTQTRNQTGH